MPLAELRTALGRPVDGAGLRAYRLAFGALMAIAAVRYWANGWIETQLTDPVVRFPWPGLEWIRPLPGLGTHALFAVMIAAALLIAADRLPRLGAAVFGLCFTWVELIDRSNYLNHYYLVSLLAALLAALPTGRTVPIGAYHLLRIQLAIVWLYAGLAKLNPDWLLRAQPLATWLPTHADWPIVGPLLAAPATAYAFSWTGAAFDLSIPFLLAWRRTRRPALAIAVGFHLAVWALFPIGVFSPLMIAGCTLFCAPDWPRRLPRIGAARSPGAARPIARPALIAAALWIAIQLLVPLRFALYPGSVNWTEQGFRFAWRVMLVAKTGRVEFRVTTGQGPERATTVVRRLTDLTPLQAQMMATQPDLIHAYALHLARRADHPHVEVRADAFVAYDGRPAARLIDPDFDLASLPESCAPMPFIAPAP